MTGRAAGLSRMPGIFRFRHGTGPSARPAFFSISLSPSCCCLRARPCLNHTTACNYARPATFPPPAIFPPPAVMPLSSLPWRFTQPGQRGFPLAGSAGTVRKVLAVDYSARIKQRVSVKALQRTCKSALRVWANQSVADPASRICPIRPRGILCR